MNILLAILLNLFVHHHCYLIENDTQTSRLQVKWLTTTLLYFAVPDHHSALWRKSKFFWLYYDFAFSVHVVLREIICIGPENFFFHKNCLERRGTSSNALGTRFWDNFSFVCSTCHRHSCVSTTTWKKSSISLKSVNDLSFVFQKRSLNSEMSHFRIGLLVLARTKTYKNLHFCLGEIWKMDSFVIFVVWILYYFA